MPAFARMEQRRKFDREVESVVLRAPIAFGRGEVANALLFKFRVTSSVAASRSELSGNRSRLLAQRA